MEPRLKIPMCGEIVVCREASACQNIWGIVDNATENLIDRGDSHVLLAKAKCVVREIATCKTSKTSKMSTKGSGRKNRNIIHLFPVGIWQLRSFDDEMRNLHDLLNKIGSSTSPLAQR